jgi:hypothetical protein
MSVQQQCAMQSLSVLRHSGALPRQKLSRQRPSKWLLRQQPAGRRLKQLRQLASRRLSKKLSVLLKQRRLRLSEWQMA